MTQYLSSLSNDVIIYRLKSFHQVEVVAPPMVVMNAPFKHAFHHLPLYYTFDNDWDSYIFEVTYVMQCNYCNYIILCF